MDNKEICKTHERQTSMDKHAKKRQITTYTTHQVTNYEAQVTHA